MSMRKNVASQVIGAQMVSATDGSAFTGSVTVAVTGDAGTQATGSVGSGACTHEGNGYHTYAPAQAETNYNLIAFTFTGTGAVPVTVQVLTTSLNPHDTVRAGLTALPNAAADAAGGLPISDAGGLDLDTQIGTDIDAILVDTAEIGAAGAGLTNINLPNQTMDIVGSITGNLSGSVGSVTAGVTLANDAITAAKFDESTAFPLASVDSGATQIARVGADGDTLETLSDQIDDLPTNAELATSQAAADDATLAAIAALNNLSAAQVNTEVDTALSDIHLDHLLAVPYDANAKPGSAESLFNSILESDDASPELARFTAGALEEAPTGGSAPTVGEIADAVWDEATSGHTTSGTFGEQAKTDIDAILADTGTDGVIVASLAAGSITASVIATGAVDADAVAADAVTEIQSGLATSAELAKVPKSDSTVSWNATAAAQIQSEAADALNAYDPPTKAELDSAVAPLALQTSVDTLEASVAAIETDTQDIQGRLPTALVGGRIDATIDATGMEAGAIDAILDDTIGDGSITMRQALRVILAGMAGKLSGAATATVTIRNTADSANVIVATVDSDGNRSAVTVTP